METGVPVPLLVIEGLRASARFLGPPCGMCFLLCAKETRMRASIYFFKFCKNVKEIMLDF